MRQAFVHDAVVTMEAGGDVRAPGAAITVALCGHWDHEPPCPLAPQCPAGAPDARGITHVRFGDMRHSVPSITQYASASLIESITYGGHPRAEDPRWRESGASDQETYAAWCARWCGIACFRMALLARDGEAPSLYELAVGAMEYDAYTDEPGRPRGLIYRPFAEYARDKHGLRADVITELDPGRLSSELDAGRLVIASVHPEIRRPGNDPPGTGGHLVLVTGHAEGLVTFHNPSGHVPEAVVATLPMPVFDRFAAHRGIALHL